MTLQFDVLFLPCRFLEPKGNTSGNASSFLRRGGYPADVLTGTVTADEGQALTCLQVSVLNAPHIPPSSSSKSTISELFASQINYDLHQEASVCLLWLESLL